MDKKQDIPRIRKGDDFVQINPHPLVFMEVNEVEGATDSMEFCVVTWYALNGKGFNVQRRFPMAARDGKFSNFEPISRNLLKEAKRLLRQYDADVKLLTIKTNLTFIEKRDIEKGFKDSAFRLNNSVKSCEQWTETELKARQKELQDVFMRLWPMPTTTFEPLKREAKSASLDDEDYEFTGKKLQAYILHGVRYSVNTWKEMLIQVCGHILLEKRSTIEWLCANEKCSFSTTPEEWRRELAPGMYVCTDNSTAAKIDILHGMFEECNIPASELVFEFRSDQDGEDEE